jgi:hypothetical protein
MKRRIVALVVACLAIPPGMVLADELDGSGPNQVVQVQNTQDPYTGAATKRTRGGFEVGSTGADRVTSTNLAIARPHDCTGCEALAASYQAVFMTGNPSYVSPRNAAVATNENCTSCGSFAFAYQYVLSTDGPVYLSESGRDQIRDIRAAVRDDLEAGYPYDVLDARLHDYTVQFRSVINAEIRRTGTEVEDRQAVERSRVSG